MENPKKGDVWTLKGYDTFEGGPDAFYPLPGSFDNETDAIKAAKERLKDLEKSQPLAQSGGQNENGIQDRVFVVRPDGTKFRVT